MKPRSSVDAHNRARRERSWITASTPRAGRALQERGGVAILEEALGLLRSAPLAVHALYVTGAIPFVLGLLYFAADMSRSPFAREHLAESSLVVALLFVWKNLWQAAFAAALYQRLSGERAPWTRARVFRLAALACALQPTSLVAIPLACLAALPFAWALAFYRNLSLYAGLGSRDALAEAYQQAWRWQKQMWSALSVTALGALLLFVNYLVTVAILPQLAQSFLGVEGALTRLGARIVNPTVLLVVALLVYLTLDPLLDALCVLRCFYGDSIASGRDLRAGLRRAIAAAALALILLGLWLPERAAAQPPPEPAPVIQPAIDPARLDRAVSEVLHRREFTWRMPRAREEPEGRWMSWVRSLVDLYGRATDSLREWIRRLFERKPQPGPASGEPSRTALEITLYALGGVIALVIAVIFFRQRRLARRVIATATPAAAAPVNLADENVTADQLPESGWLAQADEWMAKSDFRLALRALHLAGLTYLSGRSLVTIQRWKSGLDYVRELERRARGTPELAPAFTRNLRLFERGWYGRHQVDREMVETCLAGLEEMRRHA